MIFRFDYARSNLSTFFFFLSLKVWLMTFRTICSSNCVNSCMNHSSGSFIFFLFVFFVFILFLGSGHDLFTLKASLASLWRLSDGNQASWSFLPHASFNNANYNLCYGWRAQAHRVAAMNFDEWRMSFDTTNKNISIIHRRRCCRYQIS